VCLVLFVENALQPRVIEMNFGITLVRAFFGVLGDTQRTECVGIEEGFEVVVHTEERVDEPLGVRDGGDFVLRANGFHLHAGNAGSEHVPLDGEHIVLAVGIVEVRRRRHDTRVWRGPDGVGRNVGVLRRLGRCRRGSLWPSAEEQQQSESEEGTAHS